MEKILCRGKVYLHDFMILPITLTPSFWHCFESLKRFEFFHFLGNHTVGIVSGREDYDILKVSCKELFGEINQLLRRVKLK